MHTLSFSDINECNSNNGGCAQNCANTLGSFQCSCENGYTLAANGRACNSMFVAIQHFLFGLNKNNLCTYIVLVVYVQVMYILFAHADINECQSSNGGCDQICTDNVGTFVCSCNTGFELATNGQTCTGE